MKHHGYQRDYLDFRSDFQYLKTVHRIPGGLVDLGLVLPLRESEGSNPWLGTKIRHDVQCNQKQKE